MAAPVLVQYTFQLVLDTVVINPVYSNSASGVSNSVLKMALNIHFYYYASGTHLGVPESVLVQYQCWWGE